MELNGLGCGCLVVLAIAAFIGIGLFYEPEGSTTSSTTSSAIAAETTRNAVINSVETDFGDKGLTIHVDFEINNCKGERGSCVVWFYYENGQPIKDINGEYATEDGNVWVYENFNPGYDGTRYKDFSLYIPYSEIHVPRRRTEDLYCYFSVRIYNYESGCYLTKPYKYSLLYEKNN